MLQDIRKSTRGTAAKVVVGLIVVSFSIFGIESILLGGSGGGIAEVNGEEIYPGEVQQLVNSQRRRLISMMGDNLDPAMLDEQVMSARALESIIGKKLQMQSAAELHLTVTETQIGTLIGSMEQFQLAGQFSPELYKSMLSSAGYTPAAFKQSLADDLLLNQLNLGLAGSDFATAKELELNAAYTAESRDVRYLTIPLERFSVDTEIGEEEISQYHQDNQLAFRTLESVDVDYIQLTVDDFRVPVEESVVLEQYELARENYEYKTESRVSHILFEPGADEAEAVFQARIQSAGDQLAAGMDFAELATSVSDDLGSANDGGNLGFTQGDTFPPEMEKAITQLELGMVSAPVITDAGTHLIRLVERRDGSMPPLEELRAELEDAVQTQEARRELLLLVENLRDLTFNAEDLSVPAQELGLEIKQIEGIQRTHTEGLFTNRALLTAVFSEEVLDQGHNSDVIELPEETYVALRVRKHHKPELKPLESVRDEIQAIIIDAAARDAVAAAAEQALAQLTSGKGLEEFANDNDYQWQVELAANRGNPMLPRSVLQRVFNLPEPPQGQSTFDYVATPTGDVQVFELARVTPGVLAVLTPAQKTQLREQITTEYARLVNTEFQRGLREKADITVL